MSDLTVGRVSWDAPAQDRMNDFLSMKSDGQYMIRVIGSGVFKSAAHYVDDVNGKNRRVRCAGRDCVLCREGLEPKIVYAVEVYSFDQKRAAILEFGAQVYGAFGVIAKSPHFGGDLRKITVIIDRNKSRGPSGMYSVMPVNQDKLPENVAKDCKAFLDKKIDLDKIYGFSTNDEILRKLGRVVSNKVGESSAKGVASVDPSLVEGTATADGDDDFTF